MNTQIASQLYYKKYRLLFSFDSYMDLLQSGFSLLQSDGLHRHCEQSELKAISVALEYNLEAMAKQ